MGVFLVYILKSAVCLSAFYLFYRLLLSRETFHRFNRFAILGLLALSLLIPLCEVHIEQRTEVQQTVLSLEQLLLAGAAESPVVRTPNEGAVWVRLIVLVYLAGVVFLLIRNICSFIRLCLLLRSGEWKTLEHKLILVTHNRDNLAPFSWMRFVVISRKDFDESGREILIHELAHIRSRHSLDLLVADVCILFQWFNPAAWLLKQELQNIHEYEADERVIREGVDAKQYQLLIIKKAVGARLYSMANSFNHSKLKKRITMMLKEKSNPWARLKYLYVLPLAAIAVSAFARPELSNGLKELAEVKVNEFTANAATVEPENDVLPQPADTVKAKTGKKEEVRVYITSSPDSIKALNGKVISVSEKSVKVINGKVSSDVKLRVAQLPNTEPGDTLDVQLTVNKEKPLIFVDGVEVPAEIMKALDANKIESFEVYKEDAAVERYGDKGKNGVILITLKKKTNEIIVLD